MLTLILRLIMWKVNVLHLFFGEEVAFLTFFLRSRFSLYPSWLDLDQIQSICFLLGPFCVGAFPFVNSRSHLRCLAKRWCKASACSSRKD